MLPTAAEQAIPVEHVAKLSSVWVRQRFCDRECRLFLERLENHYLTGNVVALRCIRLYSFPNTRHNESQQDDATSPPRSQTSQTTAPHPTCLLCVRSFLHGSSDMFNPTVPTSCPDIFLWSVCADSHRRGHTSPILSSQCADKESSVVAPSKSSCGLLDYATYLQCV